jgi:hypothetical protein
MRSYLRINKYKKRHWIIIHRLLVVVVNKYYFKYMVAGCFRDAQAQGIVF